MKKYQVFVAKASFDRTVPYYKEGHIDLALQRNILADSRSDAVNKLLPEISKLIDSMTDQTIKYIAVFCGTGRHVAERLTSIQVDVSTKQIRR